MSIRKNNKIIAGNYKTDIITDATQTESGKIRIATDNEVEQGLSKDTAITPYQLANASSKTQVDNETIVKDNEDIITTVGVKSKSNVVLYDWIGTKEEYETGIANGSILEDWICWVTDDEGGDKYRSMPIGMIYSLNCTEDYIPDGSLPCNGSEYTRTQFYGLWENYIETNYLNNCTYTEYETELATYGQCVKFAVDVDNKKFRVPLIKDTETVVTNNVNYDNGVEIDCPISTAPFTAPYDGVYMTTLTKGNTNGYLYVNGVHTPFYRGDATGGDSWDNFFVPLSKGDVIYWEVTLTPKASHFYPYKEETKEKLKSFVVVANGQTNQSLMDWSAWASSLQGKANTDLSNCTKPYVIETSDKSILPSWYRVWSDGWCEQGGIVTAGSNDTGNQVSLLQNLKNNYSLRVYVLGESDSFNTAGTWVKTRAITNSSFYITSGYTGASSTAYTSYKCSWEAKGYIN